MFAPIALFVYNRPEHTKRTIQALKANKGASESSLYIFSDGPKNAAAAEKVKMLREYLQSVDGFQQVTLITQDENLGLSRSIIQGVSKLLNEHGKLIILEDDLVTSPYFLTYMNRSLEQYEHEESVACISGYVYPLKATLPDSYFIKGADCWGWATWKRAWDLFEPDVERLITGLKERKQVKAFDFGSTYPYFNMLTQQAEGKIDSWAIRWYASAFLQHKLCLYPAKTLVENIGQDGSGTHGDQQTTTNTALNLGPVALPTGPPQENSAALRAFESYFFRKHGRKKNALQRLFFRLKQLRKRS